MDLNVFGFVPSLDETFVPSLVDTDGRYAFGKQASAVRWALLRLADALSGKPLATESDVLGHEEHAFDATSITGWLRHEDGRSIVRREFNGWFARCSSVQVRVRLGLPIGERKGQKNEPHIEESAKVPSRD